ncbi:hypothetical protein M407DRAFT_202356 [Tulasnella calospora MUT 4182]|uniref:Uncharacterized protein n=1 Tax=Tulasnella calospora MUT 4182 TaxID=1051891 RepID=A0A0C3Q0H3_9AGAM|nr:hypothetical protein M407DRAFT_202356 [Tulasnella calospora MUT 4182]
MDQLDARFCCQSCPSGDSVVRNWRNCAVHVRIHEKVSNSSWAVLTPQERDLATTLENQNPDERPRLLCKLCTQSQVLTRDRLSNHLNAIHSSKPDSSNWKEVLSIPPTPVSLKSPHHSYSFPLKDSGMHSRWVCQHCRVRGNTENNRFTEVKLREHMKAEHFLSHLTLDDVGRA